MQSFYKKYICIFVARHEFVSVKKVFLLALSAGIEVCDVIKNALAEILKLQLLSDLGLTWPFGVNLLTPNINSSGRTAPLISKFAFYIFIQQT